MLLVFALFVSACGGSASNNVSNDVDTSQESQIEEIGDITETIYRHGDYSFKNTGLYTKSVLCEGTPFSSTVDPGLEFPGFGVRCARTTIFDQKN